MFGPQKRRPSKVMAKALSAGFQRFIHRRCLCLGLDVQWTRHGAQALSRPWWSSADTHDAPGITDSFAQLQQRDLIPFAALQDTGTAVMVGHLTVPGLTEGLPATQSEPAVRYLRDQLGYADALVMTDALGMQAVGLPEDEAAVLAVIAGIDVVIFTVTDRTKAVIDAIERAVADGLVSDERITESAARVLRTLGEADTGCDADE